MAPEAENRYRAKYLALLDEVDAKEKEWGETNRRLSRVLSHLCIVAEGPSSAEISAELTSIRDELRAGLDLAALEQRIENLKERVLRETRWAEAGADAYPPVHQLLIHIVERLPWPAEMAEEALAIVDELEPGVAPDALPDAINAIAGLVFQIRTRILEEKRELEALLLEVTGGLQELADGLAAAQREAGAGFVSSQTLHEAVDAEVQGLEERSRDAADLEALRAAVYGTIRSIRTRMEEKRKEDAERAARLEIEVGTLHQKITALEGEVSEHREKTRQARELSMRDPLTGSWNRLAYQERVQTEVARWERYGSVLTLVVFDLDHFKAINDSFGHKAGDKVLKAIAQIAGSQLRQVDLFARYGGEEFVALLPETDLDAAFQAAEKVRRAIAAFRFHSRGKPVEITVSCGIAQIAAGDTADSLFERADQAMYRAKAAGRNRTVTEREDAGESPT